MELWWTKAPNPLPLMATLTVCRHHGILTAPTVNFHGHQQISIAMATHCLLKNMLIQKDHKAIQTVLFLKWTVYHLEVGLGGWVPQCTTFSWSKLAFWEKWTPIGCLCITWDIDLFCLEYSLFDLMFNMWYCSLISSCPLKKHWNCYGQCYLCNKFFFVQVYEDTTLIE